MPSNGSKVLLKRLINGGMGGGGRKGIKKIKLSNLEFKLYCDTSPTKNDTFRFLHVKFVVGKIIENLTVSSF